jgi:CheY-like chemotaxis protein
MISEQPGKRRFGIDTDAVMISDVVLLQRLRDKVNDAARLVTTRGPRSSLHGKCWRGLSNVLLIRDDRSGVGRVTLSTDRFAMSMPQAGYVAIVDDDVSIRRAVASLLRAHGIEAQTYGSARDFLEALPASMPDCLITDLNMPHMTGLELQRELRRLGAPIPTIVVTGCNDTSMRDQCRALGAAAFLVKPVDEDALITAIGSAAKPNAGSTWESQTISGEPGERRFDFDARAVTISDTAHLQWLREKLKDTARVVIGARAAIQSSEEVLAWFK